MTKKGKSAKGSKKTVLLSALGVIAAGALIVGAFAWNWLCDNRLGNFRRDVTLYVYPDTTPQQVIDMHANEEYLIYMLGFTPGFSYMGGMDDRIATPRLKTPRVLIPAGSVGVAGKQTGIYPIDSPGGWQLIGRTTVRLYDTERDNPILLDAGLRVRFIPIDEAEYQRITARIEAGRYHCHTYVKEDA